jgi:hypothetical protein
MVLRIVCVSIILIITIIIGKIVLLEPQPSLQHSATLVYAIMDYTVWFSLLWISQHYLFYRARFSALHPTHNLERQVSVFMSPSDRVAQLCPQVSGSIFAAFYDSHSNQPP